MKTAFERSAQQRAFFNKFINVLTGKFHEKSIIFQPGFTRTIDPIFQEFFEANLYSKEKKL